MNNQVKLPPLPGFKLEEELADQHGVNQRTLARERKEGKYDYLEWGGRIWISVKSREDYLRSQIKRRNPPRATRRRRQHSENLRDTA